MSYDRCSHRCLLTARSLTPSPETLALPPTPCNGWAMARGFYRIVVFFFFFSGFAEQVRRAPEAASSPVRVWNDRHGVAGHVDGGIFLVGSRPNGTRFPLKVTLAGPQSARYWVSARLPTLSSSGFL